MAIFRLSSDSVLTLDANAITCVTEISFPEAADVYWSDCDDASGNLAHLAGGVKGEGRFTAELQNDDITQLGYVAPLVTGALVCQPNGTTAGDIKITATKFTILSREPVFSRGDKSVYSGAFATDGLVYAANP